jgi:hypothetical protein
VPLVVGIASRPDLIERHQREREPQHPVISHMPGSPGASRSLCPYGSRLPGSRAGRAVPTVRQRLLWMAQRDVPTARPLDGGQQGGEFLVGEAGGTLRRRRSAVTRRISGAKQREPPSCIVGSAIRRPCFPR